MKVFNEPIQKAVFSGEELAKVQKVQLGILKLFKKYCDDNCINYFLANDTLKGAVENGGFLSDSEGVDVLMTRPDYDKFAALFLKNPIKGLIFKNIHQNADYNLPFSKLFKEDSSMGDIGQYAESVYISIFVLDGMPRKKFSQKYRLFKYNFYLTALNLREVKAFETESKFMRKVGLFFIGIYKGLTKHEKTKRRLENEVKRCSYKYSENVVNLYGAQLSNVLPKEAFIKNSKVKMVGFGNVKFTAPYGINAYLNSFVSPINNVATNDTLLADEAQQVNE